MVRTGILRSLITSLSRLVLVLWLGFLGSQAPRPLFYSTYNISCPYGFVGASPLPLVTSLARLESDVLDPQPGVTAGFRRMFQALGGRDRYPAVPSVSR